MYLQIAQTVIERIETGLYPPRRAIPSELALGQEFDVGRDTVRRTVQHLRDECYVWTVAHRGTYVYEASERERLRAERAASEDSAG